jgi:cyclohexanecarboxylate-CoA ligase
MHSANTLFSNILLVAERLRLGGDDIVLMASPMAHQTGFLFGLLMPVILGSTVVLQDVWQPERRLARLIRREVSRSRWRHAVHRPHASCGRKW